MLLKTTLAALIALTSLMATAGCSSGHDDHNDGWDHHDDPQNVHQDIHQDDPQHVGDEHH
jgi:hypothetical protein